MLLAVFTIALATPGTADAFTGENLVIDPATGKLTKAAEAWLKNGGNLKELLVKAGYGWGAGEETAAAGVLSDAGIIPVLGPAVLAFTAGVGIGTEICGILGIEGCLFEESTSAQKEPESGTWTFREEACEGGPKWSYYLNHSGVICTAAYFNTWGNKATCGYPTPTEYDQLTQVVSAGLSKCGSGPEAGKYEYGKGFAARWGLDNRALDWHYTDDSEIGNYSWAGSGSKQLEKLAEKLKGKSDSTTEGKVGGHIASEIDPEGKTKDPYSKYATVPSCSGMVWGTCKAKLEELKLVPERLTLDWKHALIELEPGAVTTLSPKPGSEVKTETKVVVTTNPDKAGMPLVIPQPKPNETYADYIARLAPGLDPKRVIVCDACSNPSYGPNAVLETDPEPETRVNPETGGEVEVKTNPPTSPVPLPAWSPPGLPPIDTSPLTGLAPCGVFPFGLLCWFGEGLEQFNTSGKCPKTIVPVPNVTGGTSNFDLSVCGETTETVMSYVRPAELLFFIIGLGFLFAKATGALGGTD